MKIGSDYLIVDGVHVPRSVREENGRPAAFYSGDTAARAERETVCSPAGELLRPRRRSGATMDVTAAREGGIAAMLISVIGVFADLGYLGGTRK